MTPVQPLTMGFGERLVVFAKDQPEYIPLPAAIDERGKVTTEWALTEDEIERLIAGGRIRLEVHTYDPEIGTPGHTLQPVRLDVVEPECGFRES